MNSQKVFTWWNLQKPIKYIIITTTRCLFMKINSVTLSSLAVRESQYPTGNLPEFLLVGRSNVGKSSFVNTLINRKNIAHTSSKPGKTQTLNFYNVNESF